MAQFSNCLQIGIKSLAISVSSYSTLAGTSAYKVRMINPYILISMFNYIFCKSNN